MQNVLDSVYNIENLNASAFLTSTGKQAHLNLKKLKDRPDNVPFFRFSYILDPSSAEKRIKQKPTFFSFYLRMPQHTYYKKEGTVEKIFSPATKKKPGKSKMTGLVGKVIKVNLLSSLAETEEEGSSPNDDDKDNSVATLTARAPKMDALFSSGSNVSIGYLGGLGFLDNQNKFYEVFDKDPMLMPANPSDRDSSTTAKSMLDFADQCRLDIYLNACRRCYVGNAMVDKDTSMLEVCREMSSLKQEYRNGNGRLVVDTPEELFMKFLAYIGSLPDCDAEYNFTSRFPVDFR